jgi:predicted nucleic acid-binding protein
MSSTDRPIFVDSNVLVCAHDGSDLARRPVAERILRELWQFRRGALSTQVLQEFYSVATTKIGEPLSPAVARKVIADYSEWCMINTDPLLVISAVRLAEDHSISLRDGFVVEAALRCDASDLLSEDLPDGLRFGTLAVRNPFAVSRHVRTSVHMS